MRRRQGLLQLWPFAAIFGALALADSAAAEITPATTGPIVGGAWVLGDSIGVGLAGAFTRAGVDFDSEAENSTNASQWRGRLALRKTWPNVRRFVVISLGTNDGVNATLRKRFADNAVAIIGELQRRGHVACWLMPPSAQSLVPSSVDLERIIATGAIVLQERVPMADQWHPTAAGYNQLASQIESIRRSKS
jgi:lysophospholipase L1-like esterase